MLIEEVDPIGLESREGRVGDVPDVVRPAIQAALFAAVELEPELRRDHHLLANRRKCFADELLVRKRTVGFRCVEERDATFDGRTDK